MGTLTITTTAPQDARIVAAFGKELGLPGNASAAQVKAKVIECIRGVVQAHEQQDAAAAAVANVASLGDPT